MSKFIDLTGKRFGRLVVLGRADDHVVKTTGQRYVAWNCVCDCGNTAIIKGTHLKSGKTKSCGCLHKESLKRVSMLNVKLNEYEIKEDIVIGITTGGDKFVIDKDDYEKVRKYTWRTEQGHVCTKFYDENRVFHRIWLHRLVMNVPNNKVVDHINHCGFDSRKKNLRIVDTSRNTQNRPRQRNNTSGCTGVIYDKKYKSWRAGIGYGGKFIHLGSYKEFDDAVAARKAAENKYYGEYSYDNSMAIAEKNGYV